MKKSTSRKAIFICIAILLLITAAPIIFVLIDHAIYSSSDYYAKYVVRNESILTALAEEALLCGVSAQTPESIANTPILKKGKIVHIQTLNDSIVFIIDFQYAPMEGRIGVIYDPDGEYDFDLDLSDWQPVQTGNADILRWEGGMGGRGWVEVTRLSDCFFFERAAIPT